MEKHQLSPVEAELLAELRAQTEAQKELAKNNGPAITDAEFASSLQPKFSENWTQAQEDALVRAFESDSTVAWTKAQGQEKFAEMKTLFEFSLNILGFLPHKLFSQENHLAVGPVYTANLNGVEHRSPIWDEAFCKKLRVVLAHPVWDQQPKTLVMVLQYAVICRTNDCRPWSASHSSDSTFLDHFCHEAQNNVTGLSPTLLHQRVTAHFATRPPQIQWPSMLGPQPFYSKWLDLFGAIERSTAGAFVPPLVDDGQPHRLYTITTEDLVNITTALEQTIDAGYGHPGPVRPESWLMIANDAIDGHPKIASGERFDETVCAIELSRRRHIEMSRQGAPIPTGDSPFAPKRKAPEGSKPFNVARLLSPSLRPSLTPSDEEQRPPPPPIRRRKDISVSDVLYMPVKHQHPREQDGWLISGANGDEADDLAEEA